MARTALNTSDVKIEQKSDIVLKDGGKPSKESDIVIADRPLERDYTDALAFNEEQVTVLLQPSAEKNAPSAVPFWVNGKGCEVLVKGKWIEFTYIPVGQAITTKRKYVEVMLRSKIDRIETAKIEPEDLQGENNRIKRFTSSVNAISIVEDRNPKGAAWASELMRRNY